MGNEHLIEFCTRIPKTELHAHVNGCIREETLLELASERNITLSSHLHPDKVKNSSSSMTLIERMHIHSITANGKRRSLSDCFEIFDEIHRCVNDVNALRRITREALEDFALENVVYLELRSTPRCLSRCKKNNNALNCDKRGYIQAILDEFKVFEKRNKCTTKIALIPRLLVSIDRSASLEEAMENVTLAIDLYKKVEPYIVGVELGGNPIKVREFSIQAKR